MTEAAMVPPAPGAITEGLARLFPMRVQMDARAMQALGAIVGYLFRGFGFKVQGEE